jgi:hypothetical protein
MIVRGPGRKARAERFIWLVAARIRLGRFDTPFGRQGDAFILQFANFPYFRNTHIGIANNIG